MECKPCQIWKCNNWCLQTQHVRLGTPERENKGRKTRRSFSLIIWNSQIKIKQRFRENLISFSVIYRFIGLRHEITELCSINRKHRSNRTVTLRGEHSKGNCKAGPVYGHNTHTMVFRLPKFSKYFHLRITNITTAMKKYTHAHYVSFGLGYFTTFNTARWSWKKNPRKGKINERWVFVTTTTTTATTTAATVNNSNNNNNNK